MSPFKLRQEGSVLIIVLLLMTISVSLALYTVSVSRDLVKTSGDLLDNLQARLDSGSTLEKLKYIGSTGRFTSYNLENLSGNREFPQQLNLRSAPITVGNSELILQDSAGRLGIWPISATAVKRLLLNGGVSAGAAAEASDSLIDWVDEDDLKRLNGAESYYYRSERGAQYLPRNDKFVQSVGELSLIKGFDDRSFLLVKDETVDTSTRSFNYNTADAPLLAAVLGMNAETAKLLVQLRDKQGILLPNDIAAAGGNGLTFMDESFIPFPSRKLAVEIRTRVNDAADVVRAIISFQPSKEKAFTVEKFGE